MKKKRVETFRNIRYPVGRTIYIYIYTYRQGSQVVRLGGLAPARPITPPLLGHLIDAGAMGRQTTNRR